MTTIAHSDYCTVFELRQYTLHPGRRDALIELFEKEFIEPQEAAGMQIVGQFRDLDDPNRFVWFRGFRDMPSRADALTEFYDGSVWKTHREKANETMLDSDNVLLLKPMQPARGFTSLASRRPHDMRENPSAQFLVTIYSLQTPTEKFADFFEQTLRPELLHCGVQVTATFSTESATNNFPRLPVREGEQVFVWVAKFENAESLEKYLAPLNRSSHWTRVQPKLQQYLKTPTQQLRLQPTPRSTLR